MKPVVVAAIVVVAVANARVLHGEIIRHGTTSISMEFVTVGNPGNAADTEVMWQDGTSGYGRVDYTYRIGKYEVSDNQWDAVSGIAGDLLDDPGYWGSERPVAAISWHEAAMFTNWLTSGDVTKGAYTVNGSGEVTGIDRASAQSTYGTTYFLPTEDEWYKAAYYDPNKSGGGYWDYPTRSDILPDGIDVEGDTSFDAVFRDGVWWYPPERPNSVDNTGVLSAYGTMGQGGNVWEWNETAIGSSRGIRGGRWLGESNFLHASHRASYDPATPENYGIGFRVASSEVVVPEPSSLVAFASLGLTGIAIMGWRRNRNRLAR